MNWTVDWKIEINGIDRSADMRKYLMSISVTDKAGTESDSCSLTFDDSAGQIRLSRNDETILIRLEGKQAFKGYLESPRSKGDRSSGRILTMSGKGVDLRGKAKQGQMFHMDDASAEDFLKKSAKLAGFDIDVHPDFAGIVRDYWINDRQSFLHLGQQMAQELGGTFKARDKKAVLVPRGFDLGLPTIAGIVGKNVISWDIAPDLGRSRFLSGAMDYLDRETGKVETVKSDYEKGNARTEASETGRALAPNRQEAEVRLKGRDRIAARKGGKGRVRLNITPEAQAEALFTLSGARSGVDGLYKIDSVNTTADRHGGASTSLNLEEPQDGAGVDGR